MTVRLEELLAAATPGPWMRGDVWSVCGVMPERYGEGKCIHCVNVGTDPVWVGRTDINGKVMLAHRHLVLDPYDTQHAISGADGGLVCGNYDYESGGVVREEDAALVALAPDAVRLLIDMGEHLRAMRDLIVIDEDGAAEAIRMEDWGPVWVRGSELLARLDRLGNTRRVEAELRHPCGTVQSYKRGCRCEACRRGNRDYQRELKARAA